MPDVEQPEVQQEVPPTPEVQQETPQESQSPHPLEEGGVRFNEVYRRMKEAEERERQTAERLARVEGQLTERQQAPPQPKQNFWTHEQLQSAVDAGRLTPAQMAAQLSWQAKIEAKQEIKQELSYERKLTGAQDEVRQYLTHVPALKTPTSPEFQRVKDAAWEIADEMGLPVEDPRVQRRALKQELGSLDKLARGKQASEYNRVNSNTYAETNPGGQMASKPDPLKHVPQRLMDHWKRLGYTQERMVAEAKYVRRD